MVPNSCITLWTISSISDFLVISAPTAKELDPDYTKVSILLPLPGTELYRDFEQKGYIKSKDWSLYNQHEPSGVYDHPNLDWKTIHHYYNLFYRRYYLRPKIVWKQLKKDTLNGNLLYDLAYVLRTKWF